MDVTEERRLQVQLQFSQRLEVVGTLAGGIAHDFNNLLTPIMGYTSLLMDRDLPADVGPKLKSIYSAALKARDLVQQILTLLAPPERGGRKAARRFRIGRRRRHQSDARDDSELDRNQSRCLEANRALDSRQFRAGAPGHREPVHECRTGDSQPRGRIEITASCGSTPRRVLPPALRTASSSSCRYQTTARA